MTLTEIHDNPELLADFLGSFFADFAPLTRYRSGYRYTGSERDTIEETPSEKSARALSAYRASLLAAWQKSKDNPHKPQSDKQEKAEWKREIRKMEKKGLVGPVEYETDKGTFTSLADLERSNTVELAA